MSLFFCYFDQECLDFTECSSASSPSTSKLSNGTIRHLIKPRTMAEAPIPSDQIDDLPTRKFFTSFVEL